MTVPKLSPEQQQIYAILLFGLASSSIQFLHNRSLWLDEAMLALNIIQKSGFELLLPLDHNQVAPILFLQLEKLLTSLIPKSEYGLRLLPLLSYWSALFFFYRITVLIFKSPKAIAFSLSLFVFSNALLYYSSEVKQYMSDVLVLTAIYWLLLQPFEQKKKKYYLLGAAGTISILLSNIAPIVLLTSGLYLCREYLLKKKVDTFYFFGLSLVWGTTFIGYYYFFIHEHPTREKMLDFWSNANAFMPLNPLQADFYNFFFLQVKHIFGDLFQLGIIGKYGLPIFFSTGLVVLINKRNGGLLLLLLTPVILHLGLSALHLYPFHLRMILYLSPAIIIIVTVGFHFLLEAATSYFQARWLSFLGFLFPLLFLLIFFTNPFPIENEELKKSLNYIQNHKAPGDSIYVYYGASKAMLYYQAIQYIDFTPVVLYGHNFRDDQQLYLSELSSLKGRYWLLFSHDHEDEEGDIIRSLDEMGYPMLTSFRTLGSGAYLYDFSK